MRWVAPLSLLALGLAACAPKPEPVPEKPVPEKPGRVQLAPKTFADLPGWQQDDLGDALVSFQKSCAKLLTLPKTRKLGANGQVPGGTVANWQGPCEAAKFVSTKDHGAARDFFETWFLPYAVSDTGNSEGLFTGYYEPELNGSWQKAGKYQTPLYARPGDLVSVSLGAFDRELGGNTIWGRVENGKLRPYPARKDIEDGKVGGLKPLIWVDDPVDAFFLQIQGSGQVKLQDGSVVHVGFAGKNGRTYQSVGRILIDSGEIPANRLTMDAIRKWVHARPVEGPALLKKNPTFVFFRVIEGDGPLGAQGVALTPERSLAVDRRFIPLGAPLWVTTHEPLDKSKPLQKLMIAQDTGGAIKGVVRGDIFFGPGQRAAKRAGNMKRPGQYHILLPISVIPPVRQN